MASPHQPPRLGLPGSTLTHAVAPQPPAHLGDSFSVQRSLHPTATLHALRRSLPAFPARQPPCARYGRAHATHSVHYPPQPLSLNPFLLASLSSGHEFWPLSACCPPDTRTSARKVLCGMGHPVGLALPHHLSLPHNPGTPCWHARARDGRAGVGGDMSGRLAPDISQGYRHSGGSGQ